MKYIVIDTETSGLFDFSQPADAPGQPRLAHLAMICVGADLSETSRHDFYVQPEGWTMAEYDARAIAQGKKPASEVNGLTDEFLHEKGISVRSVLEVYADEIRSGRIVVAFNSQYDCKIMRGEFRRAGMPDLFEQTPNICVMRPLTGICRIPKRGGKGFKFPNLTEALDHFEVKPTEFNAHGAVDDAHGALLIMRELHKIGKLPEAAVHYAKEKPEGTPERAARPARTTSDTSAAIPESF